MSSTAAHDVASKNAAAPIREREFRAFVEEFPRAYDLSALSSEDQKWSAHWRRFEIPRWTEVLNLALKGSPRRVLDLGCEYGTYDFYLRDRRNVEALGSDHPATFRRLEAYWRANRLDVRPWDLTAEDCPFAGPDFDAVLASEVLEHIPLRADIAIRRIAGPLRPGGTLILSTPNVHRISNILHLLEGRNILPPLPQPGDLGLWRHVREYAAYEVVEACRAAGLSDIQLRMSACWDRVASSGERSAMRKALKAAWLPFARILPRYRSCIMLAARKPG